MIYLINTAQDILKAVNQVTEAICREKYLPQKENYSTRIIDRQTKAIELNEFELRLRKVKREESVKLLVPSNHIESTLKYLSLAY